MTPDPVFDLTAYALCAAIMLVGAIPVVFVMWMAKRAGHPKE